MIATRVLQHTAAVLRLEVYGADGELSDPSPATATVTVTTAAGTAVVTGATATHVEAGVFTATLTAAQTAQLDELTAVWTLGDTTTRTTVHEIVGGFYFTAALARDVERTLLADRTKYPDPLVQSTRLEVEDECEYICDRAFVPRYTRVVLNGTGADYLILPRGDIRTVRSVHVLDVAGSSSSTAFTADELAALVWQPGTPLDGGDPMIRRGDAGWFAPGRGNVVVEFEYGLDQPPADLQRATIRRLRSRLTTEASGIPDRATSFSVTNGGTYQLANPGPYSTGIPDVDAVYQRYSARSIGDKKARPASRPMRVNLSRTSLWRR